VKGTPDNVSRERAFFKAGWWVSDRYATIDRNDAGQGSRPERGQTRAAAQEQLRRTGVRARLGGNSLRPARRKRTLAINDAKNFPSVKENEARDLFAADIDWRWTINDFALHLQGFLLRGEASREWDVRVKTRRMSMQNRWRSWTTPCAGSGHWSPATSSWWGRRRWRVCRGGTGRSECCRSVWKRTNVLSISGQWSVEREASARAWRSGPADPGTWFCSRLPTRRRLFREAARCARSRTSPSHLINWNSGSRLTKRTSALRNYRKKSKNQNTATLQKQKLIFKPIAYNR